MEPLIGGAVSRVRIRITQQERPVPEVLADLTQQIEDQDRLLTADEQTVIANHLIGEAADALHHRIHDARLHVADMSRQLETRSTATGMQMRFRWDPDPDDPRPDETRSALTLLRRPPVQLPPEDKAALGKVPSHPDRSRPRSGTRSHLGRMPRRCAGLSPLAPLQRAEARQ